MRLLFRVVPPARTKSIEDIMRKDRRYHATTRRLLVAVGRIGGNTADIGHSLDIYMNLWQSRAFRIEAI